MSRRARGTDAGPVPAIAPFGILRPKWKAVVALAGVSLVGGLVEAGFLLLVTRIGFAISDGSDRVGLVAGLYISRPGAIAAALGLVIARTALSLLGVWQSARLSSSVTSSIRRDLAQAFIRSSWSAQHGNRSGTLQELLTSFAQQGAQLVQSSAGAITAAFSLLALMISAVVVDPVSSLVVIGAVVVLGSLLRPVRSAIRRQAAETAKTGMGFATGLSEISQLGMEMHVFGVQGETERRITRLITQNEATLRRLRVLQGLVPALYTGLAYLAIVGALGAVAAIDSSDFTTVGAVMLIMLRSLSYGQALQSSSATINATRPFLAQLDEHLIRYRSARTIRGSREIDELGGLVVRNVDFAYEDEVPVLRDISFELEQREIVGIIGPSGSGKSTLVQLLLGLRSPTVGEVLVGDVPVADIDPGRWNRLVTFVPQHAHLIAGTVADNIRFLRSDVTDADVERAAKLAYLHDDVMGWDEGYQREVGEQGSHLSGGQQQRLIIARALVEEPEVLILDEPTSSLDVRSESLIRQTLDTLRKHMTIVIIAHRLSTLEICDRIMVIQDGQLKGFDTPDQLEQSSAFYREAVELSGMG